MTVAIEIFDDEPWIPTVDWLAVGLLSVTLLVAGGVAAWAVLRWRSRSYPPELTRINVRGVSVPAILGDALVAGGLVGAALLLIVESIAGVVLGESLAVVAVLVIMWAAGAWDDRKGEERPRGFHGHLMAAREGSVTGGLLKMFAGGIAGLVASWLVHGLGPRIVLETALLVALSANLVNLFDRAPGRAAKVSLVATIPLLILGNHAWAVSALPLVAALLVCAGPDLRERAMLGDAGANPLGAVVGLGVAVSFGQTGRAIALAVLFALNLASEWVSFSRVINATPPLRWFDGLGREDQVVTK